MGRIKKEHDGWKTHGLWLKYQSPKIVEPPVKIKSKKNTSKWCRGKIGLEHDYELTFPKNDSHSIVGFRKMPVCKKCGKQDYRGTVYRNKKTGEYTKHFFPWE